MVKNMGNMKFLYKEASPDELIAVWDKNIADNAGDERWVTWRDGVIEGNKAGDEKTFVVLYENKPVGEATLIFSPQVLGGKSELADGVNTVNINGLRVDKHFRGQGHSSRLVQKMEQYAREAGYKIITIGVEARETRNLAIYLHWGFNKFVMSEFDSEFGDGALLLYYSKTL